MHDSTLACKILFLLSLEIFWTFLNSKSIKQLTKSSGKTMCMLFYIILGDLQSEADLQVARYRNCRYAWYQSCCMYDTNHVLVYVYVVMIHLFVYVCLLVFDTNVLSCSVRSADRSRCLYCIWLTFLCIVTIDDQNGSKKWI